MERYFRYENAGDQYVGRVVAGLPINKSDFSILPPHVPTLQDEVLAGHIHQEDYTIS